VCKNYCLIFFLIIGTGCSSLQYQQARINSETPWGACKVSGAFDGTVELFLLSEEAKKKRWLEGHSDFKLHDETWKVAIRSDFYTNNNEHFCASLLTLRKSGLAYAKESKEIIRCENSLNISPSVRIYLKSKNNKWESVRFDCKEKETLSFNDRKKGTLPFDDKNYGDSLLKYSDVLVLDGLSLPDWPDKQR